MVLRTIGIAYPSLLFCDSICIHNAGARSTGSWRFAVLLVVVVSVPQQPGTLYKNVFSCTIQSVAFAMLLPSAAKLSQSCTSFEGIITHVSVLSYSMYLINLMIVQLIVANFSETAKQWGAWSYVIYWIAVIVLSYLLYILVEKPFMKLRKRVTFVSPQISQRP